MGSPPADGPAARDQGFSSGALGRVFGISRQHVQPDRSEIDMHEAHDATHLDAPIDCCSRG